MKIRGRRFGAISKAHRHSGRRWRNRNAPPTQGGECRHAHTSHRAKLRDPVPAAIDHDRQLRFGFLQEIAQDAIEVRDVLNRQARDRVHTAAPSFLAVGGSTGMATGVGALFGTSLCLLNLCSRICETAFSDANTFCPVLETTSKLWTRFFRLFSTYSR